MDQDHCSVRSSCAGSYALTCSGKTQPVIIWKAPGKQRGKGAFEMKKTRFSEEQMIGAVKQLEAGRAAAEIAREVGVSDQTLYNWRAKYSCLEVNEAKRLRELEDENRRLKTMVADLSLDKEAAGWLRDVL